MNVPSLLVAESGIFCERRVSCCKRFYGRKLKQDAYWSIRQLWKVYEMMSDGSR
jgi:hypothetical protein